MGNKYMFTIKYIKFLFSLRNSHSDIDISIDVNILKTIYYMLQAEVHIILFPICFSVIHLMCLNI